MIFISDYCKDTYSNEDGESTTNSIEIALNGSIDIEFYTYDQPKLKRIFNRV